jgi:hypothetical protein
MAGPIRKLPALVDAAHVVKIALAIIRIVRGQIAEIKPFYV